MSLSLARRLDLCTFTTYDLNALRRLPLITIKQAHLLFSRRGFLTNPFFRQHSMLISTAFLNLWKAISTIVGDPSVDRDYQSRYKRLGFDYEFFTQKIEKVRDLRNHYDVAHYSLDPAHLETVEKSFGEAAQIANEVIRRYRTDKKDKE